MSSIDANLMACVLACVREVPRRPLDELCDALRRTHDWTKAALVTTKPAHVTVVGRLFRVAASNASTPTDVANLLALAAEVDGKWPGRTECEVAWTGPTQTMSTLRRTEQALLAVLQEAREEVWLVSFAAYRVQSVLDALLAAAARGCRVKILLESAAESDGKLRSGGVAALPDEVMHRCEVFVWPREKRPKDDRGNHGTLHAKCAVADQRVLFVGSANLTEHAFEINIELGLLVRGGDAPAEVHRQLQWLEQTKAIARSE